VRDPSAVERWVFDVDGCLVDSLTGTSLRPGARELLTHLNAGSASVVWWSAGGEDYARRRAEQFGLNHLVQAFRAKTGRDVDGKYTTCDVTEAGVAVIFVDDRPEDLPSGATVVPVSPYLIHNPHDRGLSDAARRAGVTPSAV
jgi:long-chain acyl-CoA synthetase